MFSSKGSMHEVSDELPIAGRQVEPVGPLPETLPVGSAASRRLVSGDNFPHHASSTSTSFIDRDYGRELKTVRAACGQPRTSAQFLTGVDIVGRGLTLPACIPDRARELCTLGCGRFRAWKVRGGEGAAHPADFQFGHVQQTPAAGQFVRDPEQPLLRALSVTRPR